MTYANKMRQSIVILWLGLWQEVKFKFHCSSIKIWISSLTTPPSFRYPPPLSLTLALPISLHDQNVNKILTCYITYHPSTPPGIMVKSYTYGEVLSHKTSLIYSNLIIIKASANCVKSKDRSLPVTMVTRDSHVRCHTNIISKLPIVQNCTQKQQWHFIWLVDAIVVS